MFLALLEMEARSSFIPSKLLNALVKKSKFFEMFLTRFDSTISRYLLKFSLALIASLVE
jgi:hypothetical protein